MTFDSFQWVAEKLGIPTLFCTILCTAIYFTASWVAKHVAEPVVTKHVEFLDTEQASMKAIAEQSVKQTDAILKQADASTKQAENMERQSRQMEQHTALLEGIARYSKDTRDDQRKFPAVAEKMP